MFRTATSVCTGKEQREESWNLARQVANFIGYETVARDRRVGLENSVTIIEMPSSNLIRLLVRNRLCGRLCATQICIICLNGGDGISDPSSASTSFESNTDNSATAGSAENKARVDSADKKRLQYKSSKQFRRRISVISNDETLTYQNPHESDISRELQKIFDRSISHSSDSRKSSQSTLYDKSSRKDACNMMLDRQPRRTSYDSRDFNTDRRRRSHDFFYGRHTEPPSHSDFPQSRRSSHGAVYGTLSRRLPHELPMQPIFEQNYDIIGGHSCAINERRLHHDENLSYEQNKNRKKHERRPGCRVQHATTAYDADFWPRSGSPDLWKSRSLLLRRKFLSTAAVSSLDSTNSTESSAPDAMFVSSVDSGGSDLDFLLCERIREGWLVVMFELLFKAINSPLLCIVVRNQSQARLDGKPSPTCL
uniref:PI3K/PI4K domain-containing protein n=1 Tax=Angiostrongylus cantonensis TaxID=6313 RepID=A0A0K0DL01_ANGCA